MEEASLKRLVSDLQDIVAALFPATWSLWCSGHGISIAAPWSCLPKPSGGKPHLVRSETKSGNLLAGGMGSLRQ